MKIQRSFLSFLDSNGIKYSKTDNLVSFQQGDVVFLFLCDMKDPDFYRMVIPNIDVGVDVISIVGVLNRLTKNYKVGKAESFGDKVWLVFEQFICDPNADNTSLYVRSIKILSAMFNDLRESVVKQTQDGLEHVNPTLNGQQSQ